MTTAFNPDDPVQAGFLSALAHGESGVNGSSELGFGGSNLSTAPTDQYGFPQWGGATTSAGPTHAAGLFQFQPGTWDDIASKYGLNFSNPSDQAEGAWYLAQEKDPNLESDLSSGNLSTVQSDIGSTWTSANSGTFLNDLANGTGADLSGVLNGGGSSANSSGTSGGSGGSASSASGGLITDIENWFLRGGLIIVGGLVAIVALYMLMSNNGVVPKPSTVAKGALAAI